MSPPAPMPCIGPGGDQLEHVLGQARQHRAHQEDDDRQLEEVLAAVEVAELPPQRCRDGRGQQVGGHHPRQVVQPVEVAGDGGQRRRHDRLVERGQDHAQHERHQDHEDPAVLGLVEFVVDRRRRRGDGRVRSHGRPPCRAPTTAENRPEEGPEPGQVLVVPALEQPVEPGPSGLQHPLEGPPTGRGQADARGPAVVGIGVPDHEPVALELLDLAGHRGGVDVEHLGQGRHPDGVAVDVELVEGGRAGPVEPHARPTATGARAPAPG